MYMYMYMYAAALYTMYMCVYMLIGCNIVVGAFFQLFL